MAKFAKCPYCGAALDHSERCDCGGENAHDDPPSAAAVKSEPMPIRRYRNRIYLGVKPRRKRKERAV